MRPDSDATGDTHGDADSHRYRNRYTYGDSDGHANGYTDTHTRVSDGDHAIEQPDGNDWKLGLVQRRLTRVLPRRQQLLESVQHGRDTDLYRELGLLRD